VITGHTRLVAHLGLPTAPFKSPMIYNPWFEARGIDAVVVPMGVASQDYTTFLPTLFRLTNIIGALVAMPHKVATAALVGRSSRAVEVAGACNAVRRGADGALEGEQFDGDGFVRALGAAGVPLAGASALVVGAGGVGAPIAAALARDGVARLGVFDLRSAAAEELAARLLSSFPHLALEAGGGDPAGFDIVVNATPLGMASGDPLPVDVGRIAPGAAVGDVVMEGETPLMAAARSRGCRVIGGMDMLYAQIPSYLAWFGLPPATADELRALSTAGEDDTRLCG
jgi:shikimate dehydrogenase